METDTEREGERRGEREKEGLFFYLVDSSKTTSSKLVTLIEVVCSCSDLSVGEHPEIFHAQKRCSEN
jgi:hypothetical protein